MKFLTWKKISNVLNCILAIAACLNVLININPNVLLWHVLFSVLSAVYVVSLFRRLDDVGALIVNLVIIYLMYQSFWHLATHLSPYIMLRIKLTRFMIPWAIALVFTGWMMKRTGRSIVASTPQGPDSAGPEITHG